MMDWEWLWLGAGVMFWTVFMVLVLVAVMGLFLFFEDYRAKLDDKRLEQFERRRRKNDKSVL